MEWSELYLVVILAAVVGVYWAMGYWGGRVTQYAEPDKPLPSWAKRLFKGYLAKHQPGGKEAE